MAVDAFEHDGPVADDRVEIGGGREALVGPQFLVPAAAEDPARRRDAPRHKSRSRCCRSAIELVPVKVELECAEAEPHHMAVRVDQAGQKRAAPAVDR